MWVPAKTGRALLDEFLIQCSEWADPNDHAVNKFIFKLVSQKERGEETTSKFIQRELNRWSKFSEQKLRFFSKVKILKKCF